MAFYQILDGNNDSYTAGQDGNVFGTKAEAENTIKALEGDDWHVSELSREDALARNADLVRQYDGWRAKWQALAS